MDINQYILYMVKIGFFTFTFFADTSEKLRPITKLFYGLLIK